MKNFKYLKTFEGFSMAEPKPQTRPGTAPTTTPDVRPGKPGTRPQRRSPIRRHKPALDPKPKAELDDVLELLDISASEEQKKKLIDYYGNK